MGHRNRPDCREWHHHRQLTQLHVGGPDHAGTTYRCAVPLCPAARACVMRGGKRLAGGNNKKPDMSQFSKWMIADIRPLLWIVTLGGLALAAYCVPGWIYRLSAVDLRHGGPPWSAHGTVCVFYLNLCKSDHKEGGITFESAKASGFQKEPSGQVTGSENSPGI